jgi:multiple antibiotic resistance protein
MSEAAKSILLVVSALFPIVDPIGGSPIFLSLTRDYPQQSRKTLARHIAVNSFILLIGSYTIGSYILAFFGLSLPVVQVGGGLVVISTGWTLLNQKDQNDRGAIGRTVSKDVLKDAFYPLTLPLTVGPGSISVAVTLGANEPHQLQSSVMAFGAAALGAALVAASIYICYGFADRLADIVGPTGMNVILRLASFLLVCIGVQILWNGTSRLLSSLVHP